ncbi:MAG: PIG-L deacetylase family protein [Pseudomonadota bacterium]
MIIPQAGYPGTALLLSAHTDDCEIGMGGTIARLVEAGVTIRWLVFCNAWESLPEGLPRDTLLQEQRAAATAFNIPHDNLRIADIPVRHFPAHRQTILEALVEEACSHPPDLVFCPSPQDRHQDHLTLAQEAERAFKRTTLMGYHLPWNLPHSTQNAHVALNDQHLDIKLKAVSCYKSQAQRPYFQPGAIETLLTAAGIASGHAMAEPFEVIRLHAPI